MSPTSSFRVLALDPGFDRLGVALVERQNGKDTLLYSTCLGSNEKDFTLRLLDLGNQIEKVVAEWSPQSFALEKLFFTNEIYIFKINVFLLPMKYPILDKKLLFTKEINNFQINNFFLLKKYTIFR